MKITSFHIQNYKCLRNVNQENCTDFHALIGSNSSGKTSIFEALNLTKQILVKLPTEEIVCGGVGEYDNKRITIDLEIELPDELRETYLFHFLNIQQHIVDEILKTDSLKWIRLQLVVNVAGKKSPNMNYHLLVTLHRLSVSIDRDKFVIFYDTKANGRVRFKPVPGQEEKKSLSNTPLINYLQNLPETETASNDSQFANVGQFIGRFLQDLRESLRDIQAVRESTKLVPTKYVVEESQIGKRGENLANFMDTMYTNERERYYEVEKYCKNIFPNIESIRPEKLPNEQIRIVLTKKNLSHTISMGEEGRGLDQLLIVIWKIATSRPGTIWLLDEPEIHLHPGAEKLLYDFLLDETYRRKQIIVATHSMVFIHKSKENEISLLLNKDGFTELATLDNLITAEVENKSLVTDEIRSHVYQALGYDSTFAFEPIIVVVVEGKTDEAVFQKFSQILEKPIDNRATKFIPVGDKRQVEKFSPVLTYAASGKKILIILDNDNEKPIEIQKKILEREKGYRNQIGITYPLLDESNFSFYREDAYSIEYYLLDAKAICKAAKADDPSLVDNIKNRIKSELAKPITDQMRPKDLLKLIWSDNGFGPYNDSETPKKIAGNTTKDYLLQFPEIVQIIDKINS